MTVLLNPDTVLVDDFLHELARLARTHPHALHVPRLLEPDDLAQALTFATRIAARAALRRDASRERAQLAALLAARRETGS